MTKFYGIGVGPGDEKLLTIKAAETLEILDVLLIPETQKNKEGVAKRIANKYLREDLEIVYIDFPMVINEEVFVNAGMKAADIIEAEIAKGKNVGFITLGDPGVFSTYGYIVKALKIKGKVEIETIPGITSFCAAAAMANRPLIEKNEVLAVIPMNATDEQVDKVLKTCDAFAFMKVYKREERVVSLLKNNELDENGILALNCGFDNAEVKEDVVPALEENNNYLSVVLTRK